MHYQDGELMCISSRRTRSRRDYLRVGKIEVSLEWTRVVAVIMLEESFYDTNILTNTKISLIDIFLGVYVPQTKHILLHWIHNREYMWYDIRKQI